MTKTIYLIFAAFAVFILSNQLSNASQLTGLNGSTVYHLNEKHVWETVTIQSLTKVNDMWAAGNYAWAIGENKGFNRALAFYNGHQWALLSTPHNLSQYQLILGYPDAGDKPTFWICASGNQASELELDYYNGEQWIEYDNQFAISAPLVGNVNAIVATSSGNFWAIKKVLPNAAQSFDTSLEMISKSDPLHPKIIKRKNMSVVSNLVTDIDGYPYMYVLLAPIKKRDTSTIAHLSQFNADGDEVIIRRNIKIKIKNGTLLNSPHLYVHQNNIMLLRAPDINLFSTNSGKTWVSHPAFKMAPFEIINKNICYIDNSETALNCYDATQKNVQIQSQSIEKIPYREIKMSSTDVWNHVNIGSVEHIQHFNPMTLTTTDTKVSTLNAYVEYIKPLGDTKLVACGAVHGSAAALYYNGTKWLSQAMSPHQICMLNHSGHASDSYVRNENVWAYEFSTP